MASGSHHRPKVKTCFEGGSKTNSASRRIFYLWVLMALLAPAMAGCGRKTIITAASFSESNTVSTILADPMEERGLRLVEPDKKLRGAAMKEGGSSCLRFKHAGKNEILIYFRVDPSFKSRPLSNVTASVEFFDSSFGSINLEYDGNNADVPDRSEKGQVGLVVYQHGEYNSAPETVTLEKKRVWKTAIFSLEDVRFKNSQHAEADFRLKIRAGEILLRGVTLQRTEPQ